MLHKMLRVWLCVLLLLTHHPAALAEGDDGEGTEQSDDGGENQDDGDQQESDGRQDEREEEERLAKAQDEERKAREEEGNRPQEGSAEDLADKAARGEEGAAEALEKWKQEDENRKADDRAGSESGDEAAARRAEIQDRIDHANDELDRIRSSGEGDFEAAWKKADDANREMEKELNISNPNRKSRDADAPDEARSGAGDREDAASELYERRKTSGDDQRAWRELKRSDPELAKAAKKRAKAEKKRRKAAARIADAAARAAQSSGSADAEDSNIYAVIEGKDPERSRK